MEVKQLLTSFCYIFPACIDTKQKVTIQLTLAGGRYNLEPIKKLRS